MMEHRWVFVKEGDTVENAVMQEQRQEEQKGLIQEAIALDAEREQRQQAAEETRKTEQEKLIKEAAAEMREKGKPEDEARKARLAQKEADRKATDKIKEDMAREAEAQHHLAKRYQKGTAVKKSCQQAAFWYQKAAFSGDTDAKNFLEDMRKKKRC